MTVRNVMTSNPSACLPGDTVATAARIMKQEDVGPVLVVSDHNEKRLVGIVTDRDLAVKVVADGRDANQTRLEEVMTRNPITCRHDEDLETAVSKMAEHQVRRIPIVDSNDRLVGIVAQADIARFGDEEEVGEMVEEISQPYGAGDWGVHSFRGDYSGGVNAPAFAASAICFGLGAGLMYLLDPNQGRSRRSTIQDQAGRYYRSSSATIGRKGRYWSKKAAGAVASGKTRLTNKEQVSDEKLVERVRSRMGRYVSHPHAIHVNADSGHVTVEGVIFASEAPRALKTIYSTPGVRSVDDRLERHGEDSTHPSLQGGRVTADSNGWTTSRMLMSAIGGGLVLYGLTARGAAAKTAATVGLGLVTTGLTKQDLGQLANLREMTGM